MTYDSGDFTTVLKKAVEAADAKGFGKRKRESRKRGKLRGLGVGSFLEVTAPPSKELGGIVFERRRRRHASSPARSISAWATPRRSRRC